jgi:hypothetical protein
MKGALEPGESAPGGLRLQKAGRGGRRRIEGPLGRRPPLGDEEALGGRRTPSPATRRRNGASRGVGARKDTVAGPPTALARRPLT